MSGYTIPINGSSLHFVPVLMLLISLLETYNLIVASAQRRFGGRSTPLTMRCPTRSAQCLIKAANREPPGEVRGFSC